MKNGAKLIEEKRQRQKDKNGWTPEHDDCHTDRELKLAAMYAIEPFEDLKGINLYEGWEDFKGKINTQSEIKRLISAGALLAAEIDRLQRK